MSAADLFALGGRQVALSLSVADQKLLMTVVSSLWMTGRSENWTSFVLTVPHEVARAIDDFITHRLPEDIG